MKTWVQTGVNQRQLEEWLHALISIQSFIQVFEVESHHTFEVMLQHNTVFGFPPKCMHVYIHSIYPLYNIEGLFIYLLFFRSLHPSVSIPKHKDRPSRSSVSIWAPGLRRMWQSCLGFILMQKEEALAASSRWPLTAFVSKFIKTEMDRVGKKGKNELRFVTHKERQTERWEDNGRRETDAATEREKKTCFGGNFSDKVV